MDILFATRKKLIKLSYKRCFDNLKVELNCDKELSTDSNLLYLKVKRKKLHFHVSNIWLCIPRENFDVPLGHFKNYFPQNEAHVAFKWYLHYEIQEYQCIHWKKIIN